MTLIQRLNLFELPDDMLWQICENLDFQDLLHFAKTNKNIYQACSEQLKNGRIIKHHQKNALPLDGKCDNPIPLLESICKGLIILKKDTCHQTELSVKRLNVKRRNNYDWHYYINFADYW